MRVEGEINTAVIGGGPGGLMAGKCLGELDKGKGKTVIFEQGRRQRAKCPVLFHQKDCRGCGGTCHITKGAGGACSDVSCGLLSKYPAGTGLTNYLAIEEIKKVEDAVIDWLQHIHGKPLNLVTPNIPESITNNLLHNGINSKAYPSYEVLGEEFTALIDQVVANVHGFSNVDVRFSTRVNDITRDTSGGFFVDLSTGERLHANHVIFAGGRAGKFDALDIWSPLGITVKNMGGYIGLRVEGPVSQELQQLREYVADPKFTKDGLRIFCFCPEGKVVGMRNNPQRGILSGSIFDSLEGCVEPNVGYGNFSIQKEITYSLEEYWDILKEMVARQKEISGGNIVSQSLRSLIDKKEPELFPSTISKRMVIGKIGDLLPQDIILKSLNFLFEMDSVFNNGIIRNETGIHSPELHLWPKLDLGPGFESNEVKGIHIVGDVSGVARGIMQAMIMGGEAAKFIVNS